MAGMPSAMGLGSQLPGGAGASALDQPPPSPQMPMMPASFDGLAPGITPSAPMPPEILTGLMAAAEKIDGQFDSFAQVLPQLAQKFAMLKDLLAQVMAEVMMAGANPTSPANAGMNFPGGGLDHAGPPQLQ